jgi:hypothetical protein
LKSHIKNDFYNIIMLYRHHHVEAERRAVLLRAIDENKKKGDGLELLVGVHPGKRYDVARELSQAGMITHVFKTVPYLSILTEAGDAENIVKAVNNQGNGFFEQLFRKEYIKSVYLSSRFCVSPIKANAQGLWNLERIGAYKARELSSGEGTTVSIIDTGIDYEHPHLCNNFRSLKGYDFVENNENPMDKNGHGTHVAGSCVCYEHGVSPGSTLYSLRILDEKGAGSESDLMAAMEWSADHGAHIWNMSLGGPSASKALEEMVYYFSGQGFYLVAAAGNQGTRFKNYPAAFPPVVSCVATDLNNRRANFSNINSANDISAPGVVIESCNGIMSGTSMSAPQISGVLALGYSLEKRDDLEELMKDAALELGDSDEYGSGLVQADGMLGKLLDKYYKPKKVLMKVMDIVW